MEPKLGGADEERRGPGAAGLRWEERFRFGERDRPGLCPGQVGLEAGEAFCAN